MNDASSTCARTRGSVLVPVVAAMLILLLTGVGLSELFSAQRRASVIEVEAARAFWVAEAGLWHAAFAGTAVSPAVSFDGGTFAVAKSGLVYTATATRSSVIRVVTLDFSPGSPLDEQASVATVERDGDKKLELELVSISPNGEVLASFALSANVATTKLEKLKYDGDEVWKESGGVNLPTGVRAMNEGDTGKRTIDAGSSEEMALEFKDEPSGTVQYTLVLDFLNGSSSTLIFTIDWDDDDDDD